MSRIPEEDLIRLHNHFLKEGKKAGANAAEWEAMNLWGGRCTDQKRGLKNAWAILDGLAILNPPNLSGEWADGLTPAQIEREAAEFLSLDPDTLSEEEMEEISVNSVDSWEEGSSDGFFQEIDRLANLRIMEEEKPS